MRSLQLHHSKRPLLQNGSEDPIILWAQSMHRAAQHALCVWKSQTLCNYWALKTEPFSSSERSASILISSALSSKRIHSRTTYRARCASAPRDRAWLTFRMQQFSIKKSLHRMQRRRNDSTKRAGMSKAQLGSVLHRDEVMDCRSHTVSICRLNTLFLEIAALLRLSVQLICATLSPPSSFLFYLAKTFATRWKTIRNNYQVGAGAPRPEASPQTCKEVITLRKHLYP